MEARRPCPDSALLAGFLDGTLADYERTAVVSHLAECPECRAVAVTVVEFREVEALDELWQRVPAPPPAPPRLAGGVTRWSREKTRAPALAIAAAAAIAVLAAPVYFLLPSWSAQQAVSNLVDVVEGQRPIEARLAGAVSYAPPPSRVDSDPVDDGARVRLITTASNIRTAYENDDGAPSRRAVGVAALLTGDLDDAIGTLAIAASASPQDVQIANDLAAAYYERAVRANRPDDLPSALDYVERVLAISPSHVEALFNRALIITALQLKSEAQAAWRAYLERDANSPWATEAHARMQAIPADAGRPSWADVKTALQAGIGPADADVAVRRYASATREYLESELLPRWIDGIQSNDRLASQQVVTRIRVLAEAFAIISNDRIYLDLADSLDAFELAPEPEVISAYEQYMAALTLMGQQRFVDARPLLTRAARILSSAGSPMGLRAQIELAATDYFSLRYEAAAASLHKAKAMASAQNYAILRTRAAWLGGMAAYGLMDFASTRLEYEEMLASAGASGDVDQWVMANVLLANLHDTMGDQARAWQHRVDASSRLADVFTQFTRSAHILSASGDATAGGHDAAALLFHSLLLSSTSQAPPSVRVQVAAQRARALFHLGRRAEARDELARARQRLAEIPTTDSRLFVETDVLAAEAELLRDEDRPRAIAAAERLITLPLVQRDHLRRARALLQLADALMQAGELERAAQATTEGFAALNAYRAMPLAEFSIRASDPVWALFTKATQIALRRGDLARAFAYADEGRLKTPEDRRAWGRQPASLEALQRTLRDDVALVMLTPLEDELQVWIVRRHDVATHTARITRARAMALIATQQQEMLRAVAVPRGSAELFDVILRPVAHALSGATDITIVADAPYNRVAFAGLWDRDRDRYVVEDYSFVFARSATAFMASASRPRPNAAIRSASVFTAPVPSVANVRASLAPSLAAVYGVEHVSRHDDATPKELVEEILGGDVLHVSAQVIANHDFPTLSRIEMAQDSAQKYSGTLYARNVAAAGPVSAQLVALESTVSGSVAPLAEDAQGFAYALLAAGVPNVVSPVTQVDANAVAQTWLDFHRHYAAGTAAAESLRRAQLAALNGSDRRPGPWATLTVFGATH
jgi:tetratricopeptide (TPR) repeat protein